MIYLQLFFSYLKIGFFGFGGGFRGARRGRDYRTNVTIDFDEAISRSRSYSEFEGIAREKTCNLFKKEVK